MVKQFKNFIRGMASINLFPPPREFKIDYTNIALSDEEAFRKDLNAIGGDMWNAIKIIQREHPECK